MSGLSLSNSIVEQLLNGEYRVLITGASGWLGRATLEMMSQAFGDLFAERVKCFGSSTQTLRIRNGREIGQRPLSEMSAVDHGRYILLHFAALTKDKVGGMSLDEYVAANRAISRLTRAAAERLGIDRVFLVSSGAVYQALEAAASLEPVHPYGAMKLEDEALFKRFAFEHSGTRVVTARLFNLSGPYINKLGGYALSAFIEQARDRGEGASIKINADHPVIRSYVAVGDFLNISIAHLLDDATEVYDCFDTAGDCEVEVRGLAEVVRTIVNPRIAILRPSMSSTKADRYVGDGAKFKSLAKRYRVSLQDLNEQVRDTAQYLGAL